MVHPGGARLLGWGHGAASRCACPSSCAHTTSEALLQSLPSCAMPGHVRSCALQSCSLSWSCEADREGFISVDEFLRCDGGPDDVFAVGDVASAAAHPRPKAGVFAVRQGPALADNLQR